MPSPWLLTQHYGYLSEDSALCLGPRAGMEEEEGETQVQDLPSGLPTEGIKESVWN